MFKWTCSSNIEIITLYIYVFIYLLNYAVNTLGAELLYQKVGDFCKVTENTILLDVCCGTGTIGLSMARVSAHMGF